MPCWMLRQTLGFGQLSYRGIVSEIILEFENYPLRMRKLPRLISAPGFSTAQSIQPSNHFRKLSALLSLAGLALSITAAQASTFSVNFGNNGNTNGAGNNVNFPVTGSAGVVAVSNWNNVNAVSGSLANLKTETGASSAVSVSWTTGNTLGGTVATAATGNQALLNAWLDDSASMNATVTGVTGLYDLYVYGSSDAGNAGRFLSYTVNGVTKTSLGKFTDPIATDGTFYKGTFVDGATNADNPNYLKFTGLSGTLTIGDSSVANTRSALSGFQIVQIPEPSSLLMIGLGAMGLMLRRRK